MSEDARENIEEDPDEDMAEDLVHDVNEEPRSWRNSLLLVPDPFIFAKVFDIHILSNLQCLTSDLECGWGYKSSGGDEVPSRMRSLRASDRGWQARSGDIRIQQSHRRVQKRSAPPSSATLICTTYTWSVGSS